MWLYNKNTGRRTTTVSVADVIFRLTKRCLYCRRVIHYWCVDVIKPAVFPCLREMRIEYCILGLAHVHLHTWSTSGPHAYSFINEYMYLCKGAL